MRNRLKRVLKRIRLCIDNIEGPNRFRCAIDEVLKKETVRKIHFGGATIYVRTASVDLDIAFDTLVRKEYEKIRCADPKVIIDAGANIGTSTIFFAMKYPKARVFAVEPEQTNFDMLLKNTENLKNVIAIKAAIWGSEEKRMIQNRHTGHWGYTVSETNNNMAATGQEIDCVTINSLMEKYGFDRVDLLKMDIEGGEKDVLESSSSWINSVNVMTVELHDRICMGCTRAFYLATKDFKSFEIHGEKVTAYRN
jgi:FkbM family methyltransferase